MSRILQINEGLLLPEGSTLMENKEQIIKLFKRYLVRECSAEEENIFLELLDKKENSALFKKLIEQELQVEAGAEFKELPGVKVQLDLVRENLIREMGEPDIKTPVFNRLWLRVAAVLLFCMGVLFFATRTQKTGLLADVAPGGNKATLTLADGSKILLDAAVKGNLVKQSGVLVTKTSDGQLVYTIEEQISHKNSGTKSQTNTISTPRGGQYQINLPDGTMVWLNAASELKFPLSFAALKERRVKLTGEAYFEVKKDAAKPFIVQSDKQTVEVLGTHFNISSYTDDARVKTTLLEGAVKVRKLNGAASEEAVLRPGQQAQIGPASGKIEVLKVDPATEVAWKKGEFFFENEPIENIMREVSRWYDVDIVYKDDFSGKTVWGSVTRYGNVSKVLAILELTGEIHFKIEGRRIIVHK